MKYSIACTAAVALMASSAHAQRQVVLEPYSEWVMNYDDDSCALQRQFGQPGQQAFLELREFGERDSGPQVTIASEDFERRDGDFKVALKPFDAKATVAFGFNVRLGSGYEGKLFPLSIGRNDPQSASAAKDFIMSDDTLTDNQKKLLVQAVDNMDDRRVLTRLAENPEYQQVAQRVGEAYLGTQQYRDQRSRVERMAEGILIEGGFNRPLYLHTGELHAPMEAMRTCLDELLLHWGIDVEAHKTLSRRAMPVSMEDLARQVQKNYPAEMVRKGMEGYLRVRLNVSAEGEPTACHLQSPLNDEAFDKAACSELMQHAEFHPALDAQGNPVASYFQTSIVYSIAR